MESGTQRERVMTGREWPGRFLALTLCIVAGTGFAGSLMAGPADFGSTAEGGFEVSAREKNPLERGILLIEDKVPFIRDISGFAWMRHYFRVQAVGPAKSEPSLRAGKRIPDTYEFRNHIRLRSDWSLPSYLTGRVSVDAELDYGVDRDDFRPIDQRLWLFEAYGEADQGDLNLRLGRQIIRWGKTDEVSPVDNFTPQNFKEFINMERADRKWPVLAARVKYFINAATRWEGVYIPFFQENLTSESEEDWELFFRRNYRKKVGLSPLPESRPAKSFENGVWATRIVHQGTFADIALSYAYHFEQNPSYKVNFNPLYLAGLSNSPGTFQTVWPRQHTAGLAFEAARNEWGFRGEFAYVVNKPYVTFDTTDDDLIEKKDTIQNVIGIDRTFRTNTYVNLQYTQDFILNHDRDMEPRSYESSVTWRLWQKFWHDKLKFEFTGRYFFTDVDWYYKVLANYEPWEDFEVELGFMVFEGEELGLFGQFDDNDQLYLSTKYHF